jgi:hypothetical protein
VRCHRTRHPDRLGTTLIDAIPVTTIERTLLDCSVGEPHARVLALLEAAERRNILDGRTIRAEIDDSPGHRGTARLARALAEVADMPPDLRSGLEAALLALTRGAGLPDPATNVVVAGVPVDAHWPQYNLVVEVDGWRWHRSRRSFEEDRRRTNRLQLAGLTVLRFTDTQVDTDPQGVAAEIRRAIADAAASGR